MQTCSIEHEKFRQLYFPRFSCTDGCSKVFLYVSVKSHWFSVASCTVWRQINVFYSTAFKEGFKPSAEKLFFVVRNHFLWEAKSNEYICKRYDDFTWSDLLWNVCFWIGRIIIDMSQNGFSIDWTKRSTAPFTQGPRGKGVGWSGVYLSRGWLTTHPWQFFSIVSAASSIPGQ